MDRPALLTSLMVIFVVLKAADITVFLSGLEKYTAQTNVNAVSALLFLSLIYSIDNGSLALEHLFLAHIVVILLSELIVIFILRKEVRISQKRV